MYCGATWLEGFGARHALLSSISGSKARAECSELSTTLIELQYRSSFCFVIVRGRLSCRFVTTMHCRRSTLVLHSGHAFASGSPVTLQTASYPDFSQISTTKARKLFPCRSCPLCCSSSTVRSSWHHVPSRYMPEDACHDPESSV